MHNNIAAAKNKKVSSQLGICQQYFWYSRVSQLDINDDVRRGRWDAVKVLLPTLKFKSGADVINKFCIQEIYRAKTKHFDWLLQVL